MSKKGKLGWHFAYGPRLGYGDGRIIATGKLFEVPLAQCCVTGLHASARAVDAFRHIQGTVVSRVRVSGQMDMRDDKFCGTTREHIWVRDASSAMEATIYEVVDTLMRRDPGVAPSTRRVVRRALRYGNYEFAGRKLRGKGWQYARGQRAVVAHALLWSFDSRRMVKHLVDDPSFRCSDWFNRVFTKHLMELE